MIKTDWESCLAWPFVCTVFRIIITVVRSFFGCCKISNHQGFVIISRIYSTFLFSWRISRRKKKTFEKWKTTKRVISWKYIYFYIASSATQFRLIASIFCLFFCFILFTFLETKYNLQCLNWGIYCCWKKENILAIASFSLMMINEYWTKASHWWLL